MPLKYIVLTFFIIIGTIRFSMMYIDNQADQLPIFIAPPQTQHTLVSQVPEHVTPHEKTNFPESTQVNITKISYDKTKNLYTEESIEDITTLFEGNSDYTGDDTEDNDAGNAGFEDDFPDQKYAYDDHSAEAYSNYTETYSED